MNNIINLKSYKLIKRTKIEDKKTLEFIKELFQDEETIKYLGNLENDKDNTFIISDYNNNYIGYLSMSEKITNREYLESISLYYAINKKYRSIGHATNILKELSDYLLNEVDMLVLMIDKNNIGSTKAAINASFNKENEYDDDVIYTKYKQEIIKLKSK